MNHVSTTSENTICARIGETKEFFEQHASRLAEGLVTELFGTMRSSTPADDPQNFAEGLAKRFRAMANVTTADDFNTCFDEHLLAEATAGFSPDRIVQAYHNTAANCATLLASTKRLRSSPAFIDAARCVLMSDMASLMSAIRATQMQRRAISEVQSMSEIIERETDNIISEVGFQAGRTNDVAQAMENDANDLSSLVERITATTEIASNNVSTVASATEELQASSMKSPTVSIKPMTLPVRP